MLASTLRDAALGGLGGLMSIVGSVIVIVAFAAIERRKAKGRQHPSNENWTPRA